MIPRRAIRALFLLCAAFLATSANADADTDHPLLLVAKPKLAGSVWGSTILIAKPLPSGGHLGFIVNRPTQMTLGEAFPEHGPSQRVADPLFLGGPADLNIVFALVERHKTVDDGALQMTHDLFLAAEAGTVDHIIETESDHARFFMGLVIWKPGELDQELSRGLWFVDEPDPKLVLRKKTEGLWEELVRRSEAKEKMI